MQQHFTQQLSHLLPKKPPLLLALSGGPDSIALFHLLLKENYPFEVAHVNHGWREESQTEATHLTHLCQNLQIPFHLTKLPPPPSNNLEDTARRHRLAFFLQTCKTQNLHGVLLGHHADDQAETVLKRLFEGASLPKLKGLVPKNTVDGLILYRPLLHCTKKQILNWLHDNKIEYFEDRTNADTRFLRTRLRHQLLPTLSEQFGKQVSPNLCRLGETAAEFGEFLETLLIPYRKRLKTTDRIVSLDFNECIPETLFLWKAVIRDVFEQQKITLPQTVLKTILFHLQKKSCNITLCLGNHKICIHRGSFSISA